MVKVKARDKRKRRKPSGNGVVILATIERVARLLVLLQLRRGRTMRELVEELRCDERSVARYLEALERAELPTEMVDDVGEPWEAFAGNGPAYYRMFGNWSLRGLKQLKEPS